MEFGMLLRSVGLMNLILILSCLITFEGRESNFEDFGENILTLAYVQTFREQFLS